MSDHRKQEWVAGKPFWSRSSRNIAAFVQDRPILDTLAEVVRRHGDRIAVEDDRTALTFGVMWKLVAGLASDIKRAEAGPGPAAILLPPDAAYFCAFLACLAAGRTSVLLDPGAPAIRNAELISRTGATLLIEEAGDNSILPVPGLARLSVALDRMATKTADDLFSPLEPDAPALILCTSGSSGSPKMIVHSQRTIMHRAWCHANAVEADPGDVCLSLSPPASFAGINGLLVFAISGAATRFLDLRREGFAGLQAIMRSQKITSLRASPSVLRALGRLPGVSHSLVSLKNVTVYSEALLRSDVSLLRAFLPQSATIFASYGATEAGGMGWFPSADDDFDPIRTPVGILYPSVDATILNEDGRSCQPDEIGELVLRGEYCALGEWHDGRVVATDQLFSDTTEPARRIYRTGDMARMTPDGVFVILDRKDRMLKLNGQRIEPAEIETAIRRSQDVMDCVVIARARETPAVLTAYVVLRNGAAPTAMDDIGRMVRQALPFAMVPSRFVATEEIPLLSSGKVNHAALEENKLETPADARRLR